MLDREDIDALLIGRLYGELSSADEARLQAYLAGPSEQAKADKRALEDMTSARTAVRESRLLAEQVDPPQSISALLMQEAARRAPKQRSENEGWFARFVRSFLAHPAMAAAATLVLVVAVGGTLYMRNGKQLAEDPIASAPAEPARLDQVSARGDEVMSTATMAPGAQPSNFAGADTGASERGGQAQGEGIVVGLEDGTKGGAEPAKPTPRGIAVTTPEPQLKEYEESPRRRKADVSTGGVARDEKKSEKQDRLGMIADDTPAPRPTDSYADVDAQAPNADPAVAAKQKVASKKAPAPAAPVAPPPPATEESTKEQKQHDAIVAAAKAQRCDTATALALQLEASNPRYYDAEVKNDRDLKGCIQRIEQTVAQKRSKKAKPAEATKKPAKAEPTPTSTK